MMSSAILDKKIVHISSKRQITIPQKFYVLLGFTDEAECIVRGNELVIRPARQADGGEFSEMILADLLTEGYSGDALLSAFSERIGSYRQAISNMRSAALDAANDLGEYDRYDDVFGPEDEE